MTRKPTREDLEKRIRVLEEEAIKGKQVEERLHENLVGSGLYDHPLPTERLVPAR